MPEPKIKLVPRPKRSSPFITSLNIRNAGVQESVNETKSDDAKSPRHNRNAAARVSKEQVIFKQKQCESPSDGNGSVSSAEANNAPKSQKNDPVKDKSSFHLIPTDTIKSKVNSKATDYASINEPLPLIRPGTYFEEPEVA